MQELYSKNNVTALKNLMGVFIKKGNKEKAFKLLLYVLKKCKNKKKNVSSLNFFFKSLENFTPEISSYKLGRRKVFYLPKIIPQRKKIRICINWLKKSVVSKKSQQKLRERLVTQIIGSYYNQGELVKKKQNLYNLLLKNRSALYIIKHWPLPSLDVIHKVEEK